MKMTRRRKEEPQFQKLTRRERQIMDVIYKLGIASVPEVVSHLPDPPTSDSVRRQIHVLEEKGFLLQKVTGSKKEYYPAMKITEARRSALDHLVDTFFGGSTHMVVSTLLELKKNNLSQEDLTRLNEIIDAAEEEQEEE